MRGRVRLYEAAGVVFHGWGTEEPTAKQLWPAQLKFRISSSCLCRRVPYILELPVLELRISLLARQLGISARMREAP